MRFFLARMSTSCSDFQSTRFPPFLMVSSCSPYAVQSWRWWNRIRHRQVTLLPSKMDICRTFVVVDVSWDSAENLSWLTSVTTLASYNLASQPHLMTSQPNLIRMAALVSSFKESFFKHSSFKERGIMYVFYLVLLVLCCSPISSFYVRKWTLKCQINNSFLMLPRIIKISVFFLCKKEYVFLHISVVSREIQFARGGSPLTRLSSKSRVSKVKASKKSGSRKIQMVQDGTPRKRHHSKSDSSRPRSSKKNSSTSKHHSLPPTSLQIPESLPSDAGTSVPPGDVP
ncbi:hypothetical protein CARUB_v10007900mg [Capsella rubella]|uniref:Uncharacterized protein n=1 Tax=Capsella rubella TaxID=81985 RepID=R0GMA3_9BRAS|nr:hypothetical protein CARUB_v10007900mg [Capsella rubella]